MPQPAPARLDSVLRASEACCAVYVARGTTNVTAAELAREVGISERTFYRYFPTKAETTSAVFDWTTTRFNDVVETAPSDHPVIEVVAAAFDAALGDDVEGRTRALFPLIFADPEMWSLFLRKVHDGERTLMPLLAPRLGLRSDPTAARAAAAAVASATRIALEQMVAEGADAHDTFVAVCRAHERGTLASTPHHLSGR